MIIYQVFNDTPVEYAVPEAMAYFINKKDAIDYLNKLKGYDNFAYQYLRLYKIKVYTNPLRLRTK